MASFEDKYRYQGRNEDNCKYHWLTTTKQEGMQLNCRYLVTRTFDTVSTRMSVNPFSLNQFKTEFFPIGLPKQFSKVSDVTLLLHSNVTIISSDSSRISLVSCSTLPSPCLIIFSIRDLHRIRNTLNSIATIATSLNRSNEDYSNSVFLNVPRSQLYRLHLILNSAARVISKTPRFTRISPVFKSLHWGQNWTTRSLKNKTLQSGKPSYICTIFSISNRTLVFVLLPMKTIATLSFSTCLALNLIALKSLSNAPQFPLDSK